MIELKNFQTEKGFSCHTAGVRNILSFYNVHIEEHVLYGIGKGFRYVYNRDPKFHNNKYRIHTDVPMTLYNFLDEFQIEHTLIENMDNEIADKYLIQSLKNNEPLMVGVINNDLTYDIDFASHSKDWAHIIVVTGLDLDQQKVKISDGFIPSSPPRLFEGWYSYNIIKESRKKRNNWCYKICYESVMKFKEKYNDAMLVEEYLVPSLKKSIIELLNGKKIGDTYYGIEALKKYHETLLNFTDYFDGNFEHELQQQNLDMKIEGFIDNKRYMYQVINQVSIMRNSSDLQNVAEQLKVNLEKWIKFCLMMMKIAISDNKSKMIVLADRFEELYKEELKICNTILKYI